MNMPSDGELLSQLQRLSSSLYACIHKGGKLGPTRSEYDRLRDKRLAPSLAILNAFGLEPKSSGWNKLLNHFSLLAPSNSDIQVAARRRALPGFPARPLAPLVEEDYPELNGTWTESVTYTPLGDGSYLRTTRRTFHIR